MNVRKGLDKRVLAMLSGRSEVWLEDAFGFQRQRQSDQRKPGYESRDAYVKRTGRFYPGDLISWSWLRQIGLLDAKPPPGAPDALDVLKGHLEQLAKRLGEA
ncbi:MAG TPA: hypothetical protein VGY99_09785 [Candidatus Binataceae bacterium]|nr:hypothetical protein [Candidatus Binataceae bacterium]